MQQSKKKLKYRMATKKGSTRQPRCQEPRKMLRKQKKASKKYPSPLLRYSRGVYLHPSPAGWRGPAGRQSRPVAGPYGRGPGAPPAASGAVSPPTAPALRMGRGVAVRRQEGEGLCNRTSRNVMVPPPSALVAGLLLFWSLL